MEDGDELDAYAGKENGMAAKYVQLGSTLDEAAMVKKLLDTVPDRLYAAVAGIKRSSPTWRRWRSSRGGPTSIQGYAAEYPLFLAKN